MDEQHSDGTSSETTGHKGGPGKRSTTQSNATTGAVVSAPATHAPCGACKFLRRKCISGCIFAPYFGSDQGAARFAGVHKVFGASNVSKLLLRIPPNRRHDAVVTISYEAQARLSDPVYGCVSTIIALQQQVASLHAELSMVQAQLMNSRFAMASALQTSPPQHHQQMGVVLQQPAYSNTSSASNNLINMANFSPGSATGATGFDFVGETTAPSNNSFEPIIQLSQPSQQDEEEEDEEQSQEALAFTNHMFQ